MNMDTLTRRQTIAGYRTRLVGLGFAVMICVGLPSPSYSQTQSADGSGQKLHGDINPREFAGWFEAFKTRATPSELHDFLWAMPKGGDFIYISQDLSFQNGGWSWHWLHRSGDMPTSPGLR